MRTFIFLAVVTLLTITAGKINAAEPSKKKTSLEFDGSVVEMMNRNPKNLQSLTTVGLDDDGERKTLFTKKEHFRPEIKTSLRDLGAMP